MSFARYYVLVIILYHLHYRYSLMMLCWSESPIDRPVFSDLVSSIDDLIEPLAGYLDFTQINNTYIKKENNYY